MPDRRFDVGYFDAGAGGLPASPVHPLLVNEALAQRLWGVSGNPDARALGELHERIAAAVARTPEFPKQPLALQLPAHDTGEVDCLLRYRVLGHTAGLCLDSADDT